jgi:siroheme synthase
MIIAHRLDDEPLERGGRFALVVPDDLMADRWVKAVEQIEVISLTCDPKLYVIGLGCGDTNLITLEAISSMARADVFVCSQDVEERFGKYMGNKPVLLDLYEFAPPILKRKNPQLSAAELENLLRNKRSQAAEAIRQALDRGRSVAVLEYGDPTIWSGWRWTRNFFAESTIEVVPGLSSFNVSNALIKKDIGCNGSVVVTTPWGLEDNQAMLEALAENGETLAIFMGLKELPNLVPICKKYYPAETPAYLVYKAGYGKSEHVIETTLAGLVQAARDYREKFLGLIYLGPCLGIEARQPCRRKVF